MTARPAYLDALAVACFFAAVAYMTPMVLDAAEHELDKRAPAAACETDTDCLAHCPPPADDPDCDGGPHIGDGREEK